MLEYMKVYPGTKDLVRRYGPEDRCLLYEAVMDYAFSGVGPEWPDDDLKWFVWELLRSKVDAAEKAKESGQKGGKASAAGRAQGQTPVGGKFNPPPTPLQPPSKAAQAKVEVEVEEEVEVDTEVEVDKESEKKVRHSVAHHPPTIEEVAAYCREKGYGVDAERFVAYYTANGWRVGKNPMRDWRAAVRTWVRNDKANGKTTPQTDYNQRQYEERKPGELPAWLQDMMKEEAMA